MDLEGVTELVYETGLHHVLHGSTHAGTVAPHSTQGLAARARGVGPPRTLPVVDALCQLCHVRAVVLLSLTHAQGTQLPVPGKHTHTCAHMPF